jgi:predicted PurR-regulated permease PerM
LVIIVVVLVPTFLVTVAVADQGLHLYQSIESGEINPAALLTRLEQEWPPIAEFLSRFGLEVQEVRGRLSEFAVGASSFVAGLAVSAGQNLTRFVVMSLLMLYLLFFALRDGKQILELAVWALPIGDARERAIFAKFGEVGRATIKGTLIVGIVQGMLGGIMFAILGIQGAIFWGAVMIFFSILPAVGSALVWAPAAVILAVKGAWIKAVILTLFGVLVIGLIDNILRPLLVGRDTKMPDWLILLSTLGGLSVFGLSGFVIGPIIAAMFLSVWAMFAETWEQHEAVQAAAVAAAVSAPPASAPPAQSGSPSGPSSPPPAP